MSKQNVSEIGLNLAAARTLRHTSAEKLAEMAGTSRSVIANIESGRKMDITVSDLVAFAKALDVSPTFIAPALKSVLTEDIIRRQARSDAYAEVIQMLAEKARA